MVAKTVHGGGWIQYPSLQGSYCMTSNLLDELFPAPRQRLHRQFFRHYSCIKSISILRHDDLQP